MKGTLPNKGLVIYYWEGKGIFERGGGAKGFSHAKGGGGGHTVLG